MSLDQFRLLAENVPVMCWLADAAGYDLLVQQALVRVHRRDPKEMKGWGWQSVHDPLTVA